METLLRTLLAVILIRCSNAADTAPGDSFKKTLQEGSIAALVDPTIKHQELAQTELIGGLPLLCVMEGSEISMMALVPLETPSLAGFVSLCEEDTLALPKKVEQESLQPPSIEPLTERRVPVKGVPAQNPERPKRAADSRALVGENRNGIHWGALMRQWWMDISFEQAERVLMEPKTRDQLGGKFFSEWFSDVSQYRYGLWNDGDKFFTSYIGHPLQGAVIEGIFWQNDDRVRFSEQDFHNPAYRKALLQALLSPQ
jgi:hypothetical protein